MSVFWKKRTIKILSYVVVIAACLFFLFPIYWTLVTSLKTRLDAFSSIPVWFFKPTFKNYQIIFFEKNFAYYLKNSVIVVAFSTVIGLLLGVTSAYYFARLKVYGRENILFWILSLRMIPPIVAVLPIYLIMRNIGLLDSRISLIIMYVFMNLPLIVWIMKSFFDEIPNEIEESAMVDGCSRFTAFIKVILPLSKPGIMATSMISVIFSWNEFLYANILSGSFSKTAPVGLTEYATPVGIMWGQISAASIVTILPVVILALFLQKYLVRGLTLGAVKG